MITILNSLKNFCTTILTEILKFITGDSNKDIQEFGTGLHKDLEQRITSRSICIPHPTKDIEYDYKKSFSDNVNNAIRQERTTFKNSKIGNYVHPENYINPVDYVHQIITALRKAYSQAYDIKFVNIALNRAVMNASQNHSCKMVSCNQFAHQSPCLGSPKSRLETQVGEWSKCLTGYSENIAINTLTTIEKASELAIFGMMYKDLACCNNGHRENFLKCTYDDSWKMGFGYKKGKYSFGSNRTYDVWFMVWDYARIGNSSNCGWKEDKGVKDCPNAVVDKIPDNTPKPPTPEPKCEPKTAPKVDPKVEEKEVDNSKIIITPNPATKYIELQNVKFRSKYKINNSRGRQYMTGVYFNNINVSRLRSGEYVITADGKTGKFTRQ